MAKPLFQTYPSKTDVPVEYSSGFIDRHSPRMGEACDPPPLGRRLGAPSNYRRLLLWAQLGIKTSPVKNPNKPKALRAKDAYYTVGR